MSPTGFTAESGRQEFMQLLVTQLQNQDPLEPVGQQDFLQQLAQFSVVEGVEQLNANFEDLLQLQTLTYGADIVGHVVNYNGSAGTGSGVVRAAQFTDGRLLLDVDGKLVPIDSVNRISQAP